MAPGASIPGWLTVHIDASLVDKTTLTDTFTVTWKDGSGNPIGSSTASWDTIVHTNPELVIEKNGPSEARIRDTVSYTIKVTNIGGSDASNVVINDMPPTGFTYFSSDSGGTYDNGVVTWNIGTISGYGVIEVSVTFTVDQGLTNNQVLINIATVSWQDTLGRDYGPKGTTTDITIYTLPQLEVEKKGPSITYPGSTFSYTITVKNIGGKAATDVVVLADSLPSGLTYVEADPVPTSQNGLITWNLGTINPGGSKTVTLTVKVDTNVPNDTPLNNLASVSWKYNGVDYGPSETTWSTQTYTKPQLSIQKIGPSTATQGDQVSYQIKICNLGGTDAVDVTLHDSIPIGFAYIGSDPQGALSNGDVVWSLGTISPDSCVTVTVTMSINYDFPTPITLVNTAIVTWQDTDSNTYGPIADPIETTVNQGFPPTPPPTPPPRQPGYVGGFILPVNKIAVLLPYLALIGLFTVGVIVAKRKLK
jgi:uncharacterized repeat protein (TIGR01451 family)